MTDPVWDGVTIDFEALKGYGWYSDVIDVGGVSYPRLTGYQVAGLNEMDDRINAAALTFYATGGSSVTIGTGSKSTTIAADKGFTISSYVIVYDSADASRFMLGQVTAYSTSTGVLTFTVAAGATGGSGTITAPSVSISGPIGPAGATPADASDTVKGIVELATSAETVIGTDAVKATTPAGVAAAIAASSGGLTGFRNKIINGDMRVAQRGTTFTSLATATYSLDRWVFSKTSAAVVDVTQNADVPATGGFTHSLRATVTTADSSIAAGDLAYFQTKIEGLNCADLLLGTASAVSITISFWVRSTVTGTHYVAVGNSAVNRSYVGSYTVSVTNTWESKSVVLTGDTSGTWLTTSGIGLTATFPMLVGSTFLTTAGAWQAGEYYGVSGIANDLATNANIFAITGAQLEAASAATAFERRPFGTELALCQRYYCKTFPYATAPAQSASQVGALQAVASGTGVAPNAGIAVSWRYPVEMRAAPTITTYTPTIGNSGWYDTPSGTNLTVLTSAAASGCRLLNNAATTTATLYQIHAAADVEL